MRKLSVVLAGIVFVSSAWAGSAEQFLETSGVKGGLVVHIGCADPASIVTLCAGDRYLVQGLDADAERVAVARKHIQSEGKYGPVSVDTFDGKHLPYADNLVNLLVAEQLGSLTMDEVMRVLVPRGVAYIAGEKTVKPVPKEIDEWTHYLHGADGNAVAEDTVVGPPRRLQWTAGPPWARNHEIRSFFRAMVSGGGRVFYCVDEGQAGIIRQLPDRWMLTARDAFNGILLWKLPLGNKIENEQIVVGGDALYVATRDGVSVLDAATGGTIQTIEDAVGASRLLLAEGTLVCQRGRGMVAVDVEQGRTLWESNIPVQTLVAGRGLVVYRAGEEMVCLDLKDGRKLWSVSSGTQGPPSKNSSENSKKRRKGNAKALAIIHDDLVLTYTGSRIDAYSAKTGEPVWVAKPGGGGSMRSQNWFVAQDCVWVAASGGIHGYALADGKLARTIDPTSVQSRGHHLRCYQSKATERFLVTQFRGAELISLTDNQQFNNDWVRGACHYGLMPANGMLYTPPDECFCYGGAKLSGLNVLATASEETLAAIGREPASQRLEQGPAYGNVQRSPSNGTDWPMYRHDPRRTGASRCDVSPKVRERWRVRLDGELTQPIAVGSTAYVAAKDRHLVHAFDIDTGQEIWNFTCGGPIDSSPTIYEGTVLLGCSDGWLYCLRASDGALVWRFRAAPEERMIVEKSRLESAWRVHGSVIVENGVLYCSAGRSSFLDGGIFLYGLDPQTGRVLYEHRLDTSMATREDAVGKEFNTAFHIEGARSDILVAEGGHIFLNQMKFTPDLKPVDTPYVVHGPEDKTEGLDVSNVDYVEKNPYLEKGFASAAALGVSRGHLGDRNVGLHLFTTGGFLDDSWWNRTFWMYSKTWPGFQIGHIAPKTGQLLVIGDKTTYAVQAYPTRNVHSPMFNVGSKGYLLLADGNDNEPILDHRSWSRDKGMGFTRSAPPQWHQWVPIRMRSMVLAGENLFVAGPPDVLDPDDPMAAFEGRRGMILRVFDSSNGTQLAEYKMESMPVFDGMSAAGGKLFLSLASGELVCWGND